MPRKIAIISAATLTVIMGGWLLAISARGFGPHAADADPAPTAAVASVDAPPSNGVPTVTDAADDSTYREVAGDDEQGEHEDDDRSGTNQGDDDGDEHEGPDHEEDEDY
jgi:hypothetical protein